jgi:hypothetical protein
MSNQAITKEELVDMMDDLFEGYTEADDPKVAVREELSTINDIFYSLDRLR